MATTTFLLQLLSTFLVGSCWIYLTVLAGLRLGSKIGGFVGGLPSTALLSFFFIGLSQSPEKASSATTIFPIGIAVSGLFLVVYASIVRRGFVTALLTALGFWCLSSTTAVILNLDRFEVNLTIYGIVMLFAYLMLEKHLSIRSISPDTGGHPERYLAARSIFGGLVVMLSVLFAKTGGPILGGTAAAFPAMFISVLAVSYKAHGIEFSRAMTKPLLVTGMITVAVYAVAVRYFYIYAGLYAGTFLSVCVSGVSAGLTYRFVLPRLV